MQLWVSQMSASPTSVLRRLWAAANLQVILEDLQPPPYIWQRHCDMAIKAAWPGQSCIKVLLHVGGCHDNDALIRLKAIHLQEHEGIQE